MTNCKYCCSFYEYFQWLIENSEQINNHNRKALDQAWGKAIQFHIRIKL